ncbi:hypothetical protein HMPREF2532_05134 [Bacteroides ovatus]|nr:hypothetical protein HMPREF2532_05134 [Bacteroides ovatus]
MFYAPFPPFFLFNNPIIKCRNISLLDKKCLSLCCFMPYKHRFKTK